MKTVEWIKANPVIAAVVGGILVLFCVLLLLTAGRGKNQVSPDSAEYQESREDLIRSVVFPQSHGRIYDYTFILRGDADNRLDQEEIESYWTDPLPDLLHILEEKRNEKISRLLDKIPE